MDAAQQLIHTIDVKVQFLPSTEQPFHHRLTRYETIGVVRSATMHRFGVHEEPETLDYRIDTGDDVRRVDDGEPVGSVVDEHSRLKLVKDRVQG